MQRTRTSSARLLWLGWLALAPACREETRPYEYQPPEAVDDGWPTDDLQAVGMRVEPLEALMGELERSRGVHEIHSVLVVKDGRLVFEEYFPGHDYCPSCPGFLGSLLDFDRNTTQNTHSATKSVTATLYGIAVDRGLVPGVDERVSDSFPDYASSMAEGKDRITLRHLLTMSAGLEWDESGSLVSPTNDLYRIWRVPDPIAFVLGKPLVAPPGTVWNYSGGTVNVLGQVIRRGTGTRVHDFADQALFGPLGITRRSWEMLPGDVEYVSGDLRLTPRDMAKIGWIHVDGGRWRGRQVVSRSWVEEATRRHVTDATVRNWLGTADGYGYLWWNMTLAGPSGPVDAFAACGWGGQQILVVRELGLVVVFTGADYAVSPFPWIQQLVQQHILAAVS